MTDVKRPSHKQVMAVLVKIPTYQLRRVFFEGLRNPLWVTPLSNAGAFSSPPEPASIDGTTRDVYWPEITYLTWAAAFEPSAVVDVFLALKWSNNAWVRQAVFRVGSIIPAAEGARLVPVLKEWKRGTGFGWRTDPRSMVAFAATLLRGGAVREGRWLANELFAPRPEGEGPARRPVFGLEDYWYETELDDIVSALGDDALPAVTGWLRDWIDASPWYRQHDSSAAERSSIASLTDGEHLDPKHALIDAVRDQSMAAMAVNAEKTIHFLVGRKVQLLYKIAVYVLTEALHRSAGDRQGLNDLTRLGRELLVDFTLYDENFRVDYAELAHALTAAGSDVTGDVNNFLAMGFEDDVTWLREALPSDGKTDAELEPLVLERAERIRQRWLSALNESALDSGAKDELAELDRRWGVVADPLARAGRVTSWMGPNAFSSQEDMARMTPTELVQHLASWHDSGDGWGPEPSHEGQGRELTSFVAVEPLAMSGVTNLVSTLRPTYLRGLLQGWGAALKAGLNLDWSHVSEVLGDTLSHSDSSTFPHEGGDFDDDKDLRPAKAMAIGLLEDLLRIRENVTVPVANVHVFAGLLIANGSGEHSWQEYDSFEHDPESWGPLDLSLNWTWPKLVRALVSLAIRDGENPWRLQALAQLDVELNRHDRHGAASAVIGENLGRLFTTCPEWLEERREQIFGSGLSLDLNQQIATTTAIAVHYYNWHLYNLLRGSMTAALSLGEDLKAGWGKREGAQTKIGEWVIKALIFGHVDKSDSLAAAFFADGSASLRGEALGTISWSFFKSEDISSEIVDRFGQLWDQRLEHVQQHPEDGAELKGLFWLARSTVFKASWWLPRLRAALELESSVASSRLMIGKALATASQLDPSNSLAVLKLLLRSSEPGLNIYDLNRHAVPIVIASAISSGDLELARAGNAYMNELGAQGYLTLEDEVQAVLQGQVTLNDLED